jgi:hypothetical protein
VHASFKFCTLVFGGSQRRFEQTRCAFFLHALAELDDPARSLTLSADDFKLVNPNTGAAPIFRNRRDADITMRMYREHPVLMRHGAPAAWPVRYATMLHMTNDSVHFKTAAELRQLGFKPAPLNRWVKGAESALPLYEGKMVQMFDHRAADVVVNLGNLHRAAQPQSITADAKADPSRSPTAQYWVIEPAAPSPNSAYVLAYKDVTAPTNVRTMIAAVLPQAAYGNTVPLLVPNEGAEPSKCARSIGLLTANLSAIAFDFVARQKVQGQHLNWFILEQLPVITPARFDEPLPPRFTTAMRQANLMNGYHEHPTVADFVLPQVLALSYTAHDLAPFARDLGYVDAQGDVLPPFIWNEEERRARRAALDALFMHLYGLTAEDAAYVLDSFPIVRKQDEDEFGRYRAKEDVLALLPLLGG